MARFGESDPRWIVEDRVDGTNVHNWHWTEKDCTLWTQTRLKELLTDLSLTPADSVIHVSLVSIQSIKGEAFVNNRKNKLFASFDLQLKLQYKGTVKDKGTSEGTIEVPNFSDEQDEDEWEFRIIPKNDDALSLTVKEEILKNGRQRMREAFSQYITELKSGAAIDKEGGMDTIEPKKEATGKLEQVKAPQSVGVQELHLEEQFQAHPQDIYDCFTVAGKLQAFTQSPAKIDARVNGEFSWMDGAISGRFVHLQSPNVISMKWRFRSWTDDHFSQVTLSIDNPEHGVTILRLDQTEIPEDDAFGNGNMLEVTESGWKERIFHRIRTVFGYGI